MDTGTAPPIWVTWSPEPQVESDRGSPAGMPKLNLSSEILAAAPQGFEARKARLDAHIAELRHMLGARARPPAVQTETQKPKRTMSAGGRRRTAEAAKKRWTAYRRKKAGAAPKAKGPAVVKKATPKKAAKKVGKRTAAKGPKMAAKAATQPAAGSASEWRPRNSAAHGDQRRRQVRLGSPRRIAAGSIGRMLL